MSLSVKATLKAESDSLKKNSSDCSVYLFFCIFEKISEKVFFPQMAFRQCREISERSFRKKYSEEDLGRICDLNKGLAEVEVITTADQKSDF